MFIPRLGRVAKRLSDGFLTLTPVAFFMHLCYLDESGTPDIPGNTSHYILAGLAIPIWNWRDCEREIGTVRKKYGLENREIHTAWMLRAYLEQSRISGFGAFSHFDRRQKVEACRNTELLRLQRLPNHAAYNQSKKTFRHTAAYIHLTIDERRAFIKEIAKCISRWGFARLFAECIDKINFQSLNLIRPIKEQRNIDEQALEQVVSRFENHLRIINTTLPKASHALLIHDNNETVCRKHTDLMKKFHLRGTLWTDVKHIVETPLFVNSELTSMIQIVDLCAYALRRYLENQEEELFDLIFMRADRKENRERTETRVVGVRHFTLPKCACKICVSRKVSTIKAIPASTKS